MAMTAITELPRACSITLSCDTLLPQDMAHPEVTGAVSLLISASKRSIRRFVITEKAPTRVESGYYRFHI